MENKRSPHKDQLEQEILLAINACRATVLDTCELELGVRPSSWKFIRSRLLRCFGDRGLSGKVREILAAKNFGAAE